MYTLVSTVSLFIRTFIFPNPFTRLFELYLADTMFSSSALVFAELFNCVFGGAILCAVCYPLVGLIYDKGESPAIGSFLYGGLVLLNSKILIRIAQGLSEFNVKLFILFIFLALVVEIVILLVIRGVKEQVF